MVGDLVQHDSLDLLLQQRPVVPVQPLERAAEDRDLVGQSRAVVDASARQGDPLVETEEPAPRRRLLFHDELEVGDLTAQAGWQRVEGRCDHRLEFVVHPGEGSPG